MREVVNVLIVDDNPRDAELAVIELRRNEVQVDYRVAENEVELRAALAAFDADIILCDFSFPDFDGIQAAAVVREYHPLIPVIFVSGTISEERAVLAMQSGAVDYVLKSNLVRLPIAVQHAVDDAREKKRLRGSVAVAELRGTRQVERLEALWRIANDSSLHGEALLAAMLAEAAAALRAPQPFGGVLTRRDGSDIVVLATTAEDADGRGRVPGIGMRMPLSSTLAAKTLRTATWEDLTGEGRAPAIAAKLGWRSVITSTFCVGAEQFYLTFGSLERLASPFGNEAIAYVEIVAAAFENSMQLDALETSLRVSEARSRFQADRLERLWDVANDFALIGQERWEAMLRVAAVSIRPGAHFRGWFTRTDGNELVQVAMVESDEVVFPPGLDVLGVARPLAGTLAEKVLARGLGTHAFDDLNAYEPEGSLARPYGWRALLTTSFTVGKDTYLLAFVHSDPVTDPFGLLDHAFIDIIASFFVRNILER